MAENGDSLKVARYGGAPAVAAAGVGGPDPATVAARSGPPAPARLGEELPVFCERCGYSLHGLPQTRCDACRVLHFNCPECGHHQPINTLRPAVQRALGRLRALGLSAIVILKINFFLWTLFAWGGAGGGFAYTYNFAGGGTSRYGPAEFVTEVGVVLFIFALAFAMVGRMLLLRWRSGPLVGVCLAALISLAMCLGAYLRQWEYRGGDVLPSPMEAGFMAFICCAVLGAIVGASSAWGVWLSLVHAFLPKRAAVAVIAWQMAMSARDGAAQQSDPATSVTV